MTGLTVDKVPTKLGRTDVMQVNPYNRLIALGHSGGIVEVWVP